MVSLVDEARAALANLNWRKAAILFTDAADSVPPDRHRGTCATVIGLRRDAHLALCRTEQFRDYRERQRKLKRKDFSDEWLEPSGALVRHLLQRKPLEG